MTTPSTERKAGPLLGTGSQTSWPFTFKVFAESDIAVTIADSLGVETALVLGTDYSVTLNANQDTSPGGTVTYPISGSPLPTGSRLVIVGNLPYDQPLDLPSGGNFSPLALENELDRLTMQIQQLREQVGRALQVSVTTDASVALPAPSANELIGWDSTGSTLQNFALGELATAVAYATMRYDTFTGDGTETQYTLTADPVTLANLDVAISGVTQVPGSDYSLVDGVLVFTSAPPNGAEILARYGEGLVNVGGDSSDIRFLQAGTGAVARTVEGKLRDTVSAFDFLPAAQIALIQAHNSDSQDATVVTAGLQAALNTGRVVYMPVGTYRTNSPLIISKVCRGFVGEIFGDGNGTRIDYHGPDAAIKMYDGTSGTRRVTQARVENIAIRVHVAGVNAIDFTDASYCTFRDLFIRLLNSNQAGIYGTGNGLGSSPYYNIFDGVKIFGNADNTTWPGQRGYYFRGDASGNWSNGPNANMISNGGQISGVSHGVHMESGTGNLISNMIMESIAEYSYRFGLDTSPAPGRASENSVVNHWQEGASTCVFARFEGEASANVLTNYSINSMGPYPFDNQSSSADNFCKPKGNLYVVDFYAENIPANATTILKPTSPAWSALGFGGVILPFICIPYLMQVSVQNFASGGAGSGVVKFYRSGTPNPNLEFTVNNANRFGGKVLQRTPNATLAYNTFDGSINGAAEVVIVTDASWDQTSADAHVQMVFFG
jgi:hypothetical protein